MKRNLRVFFFLLGLGIFAFFVHQTGWDNIWPTVSSLGWKAPLCLLPYLSVFVFDCLAWKISFGKHGTPGVRWWTLFKIRWAGEAVNYVLPTAYVGGEAIKVYLLHKRGIDPKVSAAASIVSKSSQTLAMVIFIAIGAVLSLNYIPPDTGARQGMLVVTILAFLAVGALFWMQKHGLFTSLLRFLRFFRIRVKKLEEQEEHLRHMDELTLKFYLEERRAFVETTLVFLVGWFADVLEIWFVCWLFGLDLAFTQAFAIEAFISVAKAVGMFSPGSIGVQEGGIVFLFKLFELSAPVGVAYALIRRVRELLYGVVGWLLIYQEEGEVKGITAKAKEEAKALD